MPVSISTTIAVDHASHAERMTHAAGSERIAPCALVTGGSRGIGLAIARKLADVGYKVVICARTADALESAVKSLLPRHAILALTCDVSRESDVLDLFAELDRLGLPPKVLVNNAGIGVFKPLMETTVEAWDAVQAVNVRGAFLCAREAMRRMQGTGGGRIVNIGSVVSFNGYPGQGAYTAAKHALLGLTKVIAAEGARHNIIAQAVCPGGVDTGMAGQSRPDLEPSRLIHPDEVADAVVYCLQQQGNAVTDVVRLRRRGADSFT